MKIRAYYSTLRIVYHTHDDCEEGRRIPEKNLKRGKGGRSLCNDCRALNQRRVPRPNDDAID